MKRVPIVVLALCGITLSAQTTNQPTFEAATLRPGAEGFVPGVSGVAKGGPGTSDPGRFTWAQASLTAIVARAWNIALDQIDGPPSVTKPAMTKATYTINATMPSSTTPDQFRRMLQNLLIDRFAIKLHHETRNFPGYELTVLPGGPKFKVTSQDAATFDSPPPITKMPGIGQDGFPILPPGPRQGSMMSRGKAREKYQAQTMQDLANRLGFSINQSKGVEQGRPVPRVAEKTGLTGRYDFVLEFDCRACEGMPAAILANMAALSGKDPAPAPEAVASDPGSGLPDIFGALEKQLGLKLTKTKDVPVDVIVFDHIETAPREN